MESHKTATTTAPARGLEKGTTTGEPSASSASTPSQSEPPNDTSLTSFTGATPRSSAWMPDGTIYLHTIVAAVYCNLFGPFRFPSGLAIWNEDILSTISRVMLYLQFQDFCVYMGLYTMQKRGDDALARLIISAWALFVDAVAFRFSFTVAQRVAGIIPGRLPSDPVQEDMDHLRNLVFSMGGNPGRVWALQVLILYQFLSLLALWVPVWRRKFCPACRFTDSHHTQSPVCPTTMTNEPSIYILTLRRLGKYAFFWACLWAAANRFFSTESSRDPVVLWDVIFRLFCVISAAKNWKLPTNRYRQRVQHGVMHLDKATAHVITRKMHRLASKATPEAWQIEIARSQRFKAYQVCLEACKMDRETFERHSVASQIDPETSLMASKAHMAAGKVHVEAAERYIEIDPSEGADMLREEIRLGTSS